MPRRLTPNSPIGRIRHVAKVYAKRPNIVIDTIAVTLPTIGIDRRPEEAEAARVAWNVLDRERSGAAGTALHARFEREFESTYLKLLQWVETNPLLQRGRDVDFIIPWVARELAKVYKMTDDGADTISLYGFTAEDDQYHLGDFTYREVVEELQRKGSAIALWAKTERVDILKKELPEVLAAVEEFEVEADLPPGEVVYEWPDGWTMQKLTTGEQLDAEGEVMQHCVGTYCELVERGLTDIFSLRDDHGRPHVTIEYAHQPHPGSEEPAGFLQILGKQNEAPKEEYAARVRDWIRKWRNLRIFDDRDLTVGLLLAGEPMQNLDNFEGIDFSAFSGELHLSPHADLRGANFRHAVLRGLDFNGAVLDNADFLGADLHGVDLSHASLRNVNFTEAALTGAVLYGTDLRGANFTNADLAGARLSEAMDIGSSHDMGGRRDRATPRGLDPEDGPRWDESTVFRGARVYHIDFRKMFVEDATSLLRKIIEDGAIIEDPDIIDYAHKIGALPLKQTELAFDEDQ